MKKLIYSMLALFCVTLAFTSCSSDDSSEDLSEDIEKYEKGTMNNPYNVVEAINAVKDMTWTSLNEYDKTDDVYVKGKISRIADKGTYSEGGVWGNACFYISDDGSQNNEFYCFRILYYEKKKYEPGQTDIKVGDEVIICGKLMNYKGNTPETVSGDAYLVSLLRPNNGSAENVSFATNTKTQTWASETNGTYGEGYSTTMQGLKIGFYKHTANTITPPNENEVRINKNTALCIATTDGKKIKKIVIGCAPDKDATSYCFDMAGLEGGASADADKSALTITWSGSANKVILHANNGQIRMRKFTVEFE